MPQLPSIAQRVHVRGHEFPFFVVTVHEDDQTVDLVPVSGSGPFLDAVPLSQLVLPGAKGVDQPNA